MSLHTIRLSWKPLAEFYSTFIGNLKTVAERVLLAVYVNPLLEKLQHSGAGCHLGRLFMGALMYADDLVLVSGSIADLQSMIDICVSELCCLDIRIN